MARYPFEYCQKCGDEIGWVGRFFQFIRVPFHRCETKKPYRPKIVVDNSGASRWVNSAEFFLSDEGKEFLKEMGEFAKRHITRK
jgi:hypothetical protein